MKIIIDAMGGDNAPFEIVKGALTAKNQLGIDLVLVGKKDKIQKCAAEAGFDISGVEIIHTDDAVTMEDNPANVLREHKDGSLVLALKALADGRGDAVVSAGNTGAVLVASTLIVKRIHGIKRAAIAAVMPTAVGKSVFLDSGANSECTPEQLLQFGYMGYHYAKVLTNKYNPTVGLLNNGTEPTKGTDLQKQAYVLLAAAHERGELNFCGNVEGRGLAAGDSDVIVCDGFSGNIALKTYEGVGLFLVGEIKAMLKKSPLSMLAALALKPSLREFKAKVDYKEVGGAPLLGIAKPVIKAHGSSDARSFFSAIKQAVNYAESGTIQKIEQSIGQMKKSAGDDAHEDENTDE